MTAIKSINTMVRCDTKIFITRWVKYNDDYVCIEAFPRIRNAIIGALISIFDLKTVNLIDRRHRLGKAFVHMFTKEGNLKANFVERILSRGSVINVSFNIFYSDEFPKILRAREPYKVDVLLIRV